jgi:hypothetical protein
MGGIEISFIYSYAVEIVATARQPVVAKLLMVGTIYE